MQSNGRAFQRPTIIRISSFLYHSTFDIRHFALNAPNQSLASLAAFSSEPGSSNKCVAPGIIFSFTSQRIWSRAISFSSMTMSSLPPTMSNVGACTFGKASLARSVVHHGKRPQRRPAKVPVAATSARAPPVLEPKYPMRKSRVSCCCKVHLVDLTRRSASKLMLNRCSRMYASRSAHARHKNLRETEDDPVNHSEGLAFKQCERS